ncbi:MAG: class IV adenylate cyclase [Gemmataceae bacterium]
MLEVEVKYRAPAGVPLEERIRALGTEPVEDRQDADAYFNAPHRDFAITDEAFRLRRSGPANFVTYKGPRRDAATKTRTEIEVPLADGQEAAEGFQQIVVALGFRPVAIVRKRRRVWKTTRGGYELQICLDDVERVGRYIELEIIAPEAELDAARAIVLQAAAELGLTESERRSYLELLLQAQL